MKPQTLQYYEWDQIEDFLCKAIGIERKHFSSYHHVVGGDYKNLWHVWLWFVDGRVSNGIYCREFLGAPDFEEEGSYFREKLIEEFGEWALVFCSALDKLIEFINKENNTLEAELIIHYEW